MFDEVPDAAPPVIDANYVAGEETPALAFVATQRVGTADTHAQVELREGADGSRAMLAYSSRERLVAGAGPEQAWIAVPTDKLEQVQHEAGADQVVWDVELPDELRHTTNGDEGS